MVSAQQTHGQGVALQVRHIVWLLVIAGAGLIAWSLLSAYWATPAYWQTARVQVWMPKNAVVVDTLVPDGTDQVSVSFEKYKELAPTLSVHHVVLDRDNKVLKYYGKEAHDSTHSYVATADPGISAYGPFAKDWFGRAEWSRSPGIIEQSWTRSTRILVGFLIADVIGMILLLSLPEWGRWIDDARAWKKEESIFNKSVLPRKKKS